MEDHIGTGSIYQTADATTAISRAYGHGAYVCVCICGSETGSCGVNDIFFLGSY